MATENTLSISKKDDLLSVKDPSCTADAKERVHELIIEGGVKTFIFKHGEETKLPRPEAMKFLKAGFVVTDSKGERIDPTPEQPSTGKIALAADQTIATFNELSQDALWKRCVQEIGGEKFSRSDAKRDMVNFLIKRKAETEAARKGAPENGVEDFTPPAEND